MDDQILDLINPVLDTIYSPLTFGLGLLSYSPPISVHSSPPVSVHSSSTSKATSPPISVASSRSKGSSPLSPSEVPVVYDDHSPSPSPDYLDSLIES